ncbi:MAG: hypothetical protein PHE55_05035 [Methylococcaceae bacterium]|nr:hypothetical protein [Methylococcaceae bacterium]
MNGYYSFAYGSSNTTVTDPLGSSRVYTFQKGSGGYVLPTSKSQPGGSGCGPASASTIYDSKGNPFLSKDYNGTPIVDPNFWTVI